MAPFAAAAAAKEKHLLASKREKKSKILDFGRMLMLYAQQPARRPALLVATSFLFCAHKRLEKLYGEQGWRRNNGKAPWRNKRKCLRSQGSRCIRSAGPSATVIHSSIADSQKNIEQKNCSAGPSGADRTLLNAELGCSLSQCQIAS